MKSLHKEGDRFRSRGFVHGGMLPGFESRDGNNSKGDNGSSTGLGLGTGLITGALGGAILGHALTSTHNREVEHSGGGDTKTISIPTTSDEELDKTVITVDEIFLPVANSAARTRGTDIIKRNITHPNDPSKTMEVEYWACFGPDVLNLAEQIFGRLNLISTLLMALLVSFCLN
ncbi:hypothetical protein KR084_007215 [Drosophila pseudotakahashii]|nr:hypothetical protein KR084_007215 [Drosophila pseudotakahashii]